MDNKYFKRTLLVVSLLLSIGAFFSLGKDVIFFVTKKHGQGNIIAIEDMGVQNPCRITVSYFNDYVKKEVTTKIRLKKSYIKDRESLIGNNLNILYGNFFSTNVYFSDYVAPNASIILFDLIFLILLLIAIKSFLR